MDLYEGDERSLDRGESLARDLERGLALDLDIVVKFRGILAKSRQNVDIEGIRV